MALKVTLKVRERIIIGGAVVKNAGRKAIDLVIDNEVPLLREKDIIGENGANTPCKRIYFVIQLMYVDGQNLAKYHKLYWKLAREVIDAAPSTLGLFEAISEHIYNGKYYQALKEAKKLIQYEAKATTNALKPDGSV
jgi:flagellar protein FlbT